jgi:zinc/manganese transport system permease protein
VSALLAAGTGLGDLLGHPFMRQALLAGVPVAALSGVVGWFMVLRSQVFTADALSHVAFSGALGALAFGLDARLGLFVSTVLVAVLLGVLGNRGRAVDVVIGSVFAWVLGLGVLALSVYSASAAAATGGPTGVSVLFGSVFGLSLPAAVLAAVVAVVLLAAVLAVARPLLFASLDEAVAAARGVRARALGMGFLVLVGLTAAEATQAVGALLLLGLLAAPAGAAQRWTTRPYAGMALAAGLAVGAMAGGLVLAYVVPSLPPSFAVLALATACYAVSFVPLRRRGGRPDHRPPPPPPSPVRTSQVRTPPA